jgi:hypothetical protein
MKISIGDQYQITSDPLNVILKQKYEKQKNGEPSGEYDYKTIGYFPNLERAIDRLLDYNLLISDAENLSELVEILFNTKKDIKAALAAARILPEPEEDPDEVAPGQTNIDEYIQARA